MPSAHTGQRAISHHKRSASTQRKSRRRVRSQNSKAVFRADLVGKCLKFLTQNICAFNSCEQKTTKNKVIKLSRFLKNHNALVKFVGSAFFCSPWKTLRSAEEGKRDRAPFVSSPDTLLLLPNRHQITSRSFNLCASGGPNFVLTQINCPVFVCDTDRTCPNTHEARKFFFEGSLLPSPTDTSGTAFSLPEA